MKKLIITFFATVLFIHVAKAQDIEDVIRAVDDANKIANAYSAPALEGLIYSMNSGWYHTAKVHKKFGFDVTLGLSGAFVPSEKERYQISQLGLRSTIISGPESAPTLFGDGDGGVLTLSTEVTGTIPGTSTTVTETVEFDVELPQGFKDDLPGNIAPVPVLQVAVGLPWKLETVLRIVPEVNIDDVESGLFGIGIKKELTDLLGPLDKLPLHLSVMATYTNMNVDWKIEDSVDANFEVQNAETQFRLNAYSIQALASLNFPIINVYGGVGYGGGNSSINLLGRYTAFYDGSGGQRIQRTVINPVEQDFSAGSMRATVGARLSLGFFKLFADYTLQEYNAFSGGIAFSFR